MEWACPYVREAYIATNEIAKAQTVQQLGVDLDVSAVDMTWEVLGKLLG